MNVKLRSLLLLALIAGVAVYRVASDVDVEGEPADVDVIDEEEDEYADVERAHLIIRKYVHEDTMVQGRNLTVFIEIFNSGSYSASDVTLQDSVPENVDVIDGALTAKVPKIAVGQSYKHSYVVIPSVADSRLNLGYAEVSYLSEPDSTDRQVAISSIPTLVVMSPVQQIQQWALTAGKFMTLGMAKTTTDWRNLSIVLGTFGLLFGVNWSIKSMSVSRTDRKRKRALEELNK